MSWGQRKLKPETAEDIELAETFNGMRNLIWRHSRNNALVGRAFQQADIEGIRGEDKYTLLAYHALLQAEHLQEMLLRHIELSAMPPLLMPFPSTTELKKDAARYQFLRQTFRYSDTYRHRLDWFLSKPYSDKPLNEQLDETIDAEIARKS